MSELTVRYWRNWGLRRLYVDRPDGTCVGHWDLVSDEPHPKVATDLAVLTHHAEQWKAAHPNRSERREVSVGSAEPTEHTVGQRADKAPRAARTGAAEEQRDGTRREVHEDSDDAFTMYTDLAGNPAGAEARKRAREMRDDSWIRAAWQRLRGTNKYERNWRIGADGEEKVGAMLERVATRDSRWLGPIHSVSVGERHSDIDHVFVGAGGVFTINVKHHPRKDVSADGDKVRIDGRDWRYIDKSRHEASRASRLLSAACGFVVHVEAIIVIVGARNVSVGRPADGVHVVEASYLPKWLRSRGEIHSAGVVQTVYDMARRSNVWKPPTAG